MLVDLSMQGIFLDPTERIESPIADLDDAFLFEASYAGGADYLVTADQQILDLREFRGTRIVAPSQLLAILVERPDE